MACNVKHWLMPNIIIVCQHNVSLGEIRENSTERRNQKMFLNRRRSTDLWTLGKIVLNCLLLTRKRLIDYASFVYRSSFFITFPSERLASPEEHSNSFPTFIHSLPPNELEEAKNFSNPINSDEFAWREDFFGRINRRLAVASSFVRHAGYIIW